jgi:hypothetical protein
VSVDTSISSRTGQVLVLSVWNVKVGFGISVFLGQTKINDIDLIASLSNAHEEVVGLNVSVDEGLGVNVLDTGDELIGKKQDSLEGEFAVAKVEQVLQAGSKQVENHGIVITLGPEPAYEGDSDTSGKGFVDSGFIFELRVLGLDTFELDGNLLTRDDIGT